MQFPNLNQRLQLALIEDAAAHDRTTRIIPGVASMQLEGRLTAKASGILAGGFLTPLVYKKLDKNCRILMRKKDGQAVKPGDQVAIVRCSAPALLAGERTLLNLICRLSGIATLTRRYVDAIKGTSAKIFDTRKTTPLWRDLEKFAVVCGGGDNHRFSLEDAIMVKDNHHQLLRNNNLTVKDIYGTASKFRPSHSSLGFLAIEAASYAEVWEAIKARPDIILLDNMPLNRLKASIGFVRSAREATKSDKPYIEVSGGVTPAKARVYAEWGVDRISVGSLTHSAPALDFSLEVH